MSSRIKGVIKSRKNSDGHHDMQTLVPQFLFKFRLCGSGSNGKWGLNHRLQYDLMSPNVLTKWREKVSTSHAPFVREAHVSVAF